MQKLQDTGIYISKLQDREYIQNYINLRRVINQLEVFWACRHIFLKYICVEFYF